MKDFNWKKELKLLPGYIVVVLWVLFTAVMLGWILGASFSTSREIFTGKIFLFFTHPAFVNISNKVPKSGQKIMHGCKTARKSL